jgi:hypothetical protein
MDFALHAVWINGGRAGGRTMDPKLTILFVLIGTIVALSHVSEGGFGRLRRASVNRRWRHFVPGWRRT